MKSEQRGVYEKNVLHIIIGYIYIVKYSDARTVKITKPEEKSMKSFDKKEIEKLTQRRVVGKKEFDVYKTDIKTMFDDTIQTKSKDLPTAINVNGRTLVLFSALGKHFGKVEYNIMMNRELLPFGMEVKRMSFRQKRYMQRNWVFHTKRQVDSIYRGALF